MLDKEADALKEKGNEAFRLGEYTRAAELYEQGLSKAPANVALHTNAAQVPYRTGQPRAH